MHIGVDYYPEHWPKERWQKDAQMMQEAHFNVVRLAEFAWVDMEPSEGQYEFQEMKEAIQTLARHGQAVILGTPTASMPAWMARQHPDLLSMDEYGNRVAWGVRRNNCFSHETFRAYSQAITRKMCEHLGHEESVIGWQIDNEFHGPVCYCEICEKDFQDWLEKRYEDISTLNQAWGTHFWGHRFATWEEIFLPRAPSESNPSALLDWRRFYTWQNVRFQMEQVDIIREHCPGHFITHNFMGLMPRLNYFELAKDLDLVSWDNHPTCFGEIDPAHTGMSSDLMRSLKGKNYWVMEQTSANAGTGVFKRNMRPGEIRQLAMQQVARGCDGLLWFRWRTCTAGREQFWHGLLGHDGHENRRYREAGDSASELTRLFDEIEGSSVEAKVAMIFDYDSLWSLEFQPCYPGATNYVDALLRFYRALWKRGIAVDFVPPGADFSNYELLLAPHLTVLPDALAQKISAYVEDGGTFVADCRLGVKDGSNLCHDRVLPGALSKTLGIEIYEYESLDEGHDIEIKTSIGSAPISAIKYIDWIQLKGAQSLARYDHPHLDAYSAITQNPFGKGMTWYVGAIFADDFYDVLVGEVLSDINLPVIINSNADVELSIRQKEGAEFLFAINHTEKRVEVGIPKGGLDLVKNEPCGENISLDGLGAAVIKITPQ